MRLKIAARQSDLARLQAYRVREALLQHHPHFEIEFHFRESLGDKNLTDPLWKIPQKGVFTEDFFQDLVEGKCDLVVHSWKDLATEEKKETFVAATLPRADERDILLLKSEHFDQIRSSKKIRLFTSSPRRLFHLPQFCREFLPLGIQECEFESVRGNIPTRVRKLLEQPQIDGLVMAKAALDRLLFSDYPDMEATRKFLKDSFEKLHWSVIPLSISPPAPAQGALAIEIRRDRKDLLELLSPLNHPSTFFEATTEREELARYGGGCHQKIGISSKRLKWGDLSTASGEHQSEIFYRRSFRPRKTLGERFSSEKCLSLKSEDLFSSEPLNYKLPEDLTAIEVSKVPHDLESLKNFKGLIWTSGLETWKKLVRDKIWVHGSQESLGEAGLPRPKSNYVTQLAWGKLTHSTKISYLKTWSSKTSGEGEAPLSPIPSYELKMKSPMDPKVLAKIRDSSCYFWRSYSLFLKAIELHPEILEKTHCCGLGQTADFIENHLLSLSKSPKFYVFLDENDWREQVCTKSL